MQSILEIFNQNPLGQTLGVIAYFITAIALSQKNDIKLRVLMAVSASVWAAHFFLISAITAGIMVSIIAIRTTITAFTTKSSLTLKRILTVSFIIINLIGLLYTWHGLISLLPFFSASLATISLFLLSGTKMRLSLVAVEISWFIHNLISLSIGGMISNLTNITILSLAIFKEKNNKSAVH